ncbi:unnamed protein product [Amoebophrya sp. A25]|nr:unnamed protein product [Amoebophrya sp. A25]|eukprot:GSA25T00007252001.1
MKNTTEQDPSPEPGDDLYYSSSTATGGAPAWPKWRKIFVIFLGALSSFLCAGLVFGFAGLYPQLLRRRVFYGDCLATGGDGQGGGPLRPQSSQDLLLFGDTTSSFFTSEFDPDKEDAYFPWLSRLTTTSASTSQPSPLPLTTTKTCVQQQLDLSFMFTLATTLLNVTAFFSGMLLDYLGPRWAAALATSTSGIGNLLFGLAGSGIFGTMKMVNYEEGFSTTATEAQPRPPPNTLTQSQSLPGMQLSHSWYYLGFLLLAVSGPLVYMCTISFSNLYPQHGGLITSLCVGCFDASSFVFVALAYLMQTGVASFDSVFVAYSLVGFLLAVLCLVFYPEQPVQRDEAVALDVDESTTSATGTFTTTTGAPVRTDDNNNNFSPTTARISSTNSLKIEDNSAQKQVRNADVVVEDNLLSTFADVAKYEDLCLGEQIRTPDFLLFVFSASCYMVRLNFFIESVPLQMQQYSESPHEAEARTQFFSLLLPAAGFLAIPLIGFLTDGCGLITSWFALWSFFLCFQILFDLGFACSSFLFICFSRPLFYTMLAVFTARRFGFATFGKLYGLVCSVAGLANSSQYLLKLLVNGRYNGDYTPVNHALTMGQSLTIALPLFLLWDQRRSVGASSTEEGLFTGAKRTSSTFDMREKGLASPLLELQRRTSSSSIARHLSSRPSSGLRASLSISTNMSQAGIGERYAEALAGTFYNTRTPGSTRPSLVRVT